ncbi:purine biosynthesis phosphoribosylaminoimidazole carboxylase I [Agrilactobacillus composti DSM 18527 = JCM 14202]|uniref:N5-carboxyaminoimidazole ribonucleotide mutase n=1 Tax=Agrilactobacillus composti DSM 18527 = JCM 14202 TaxID=1423734 RepID=X0PTM6_9LACO|nr:5-(carboxyamino)imidazole ribonucleotide mutase [Agrilactobacillus composti]KRM33346.1 purine biosynthesis phosphoribosylaminoimidazole carboxylase I [Agrilactobacillus composti DSM 18527 = JCM 14202]GAF40671.1 phosphoribosylaminoimidazole carboxylase catalytic subunit [Agrilactobacillus composti DSM 18527 = JCM 14202]
MEKVALVMGSKSDWETMKNAADQLTDFGIAFNKQVISAHRMPDEMFDFAKNARGKGIQVIIAGAGGAAHLPGMIAAKTTLPVIGVPVKTRTLNGVDSLLSIVQMPGGVPVATVAIGAAGAKNAAILAAEILSLQDEHLQQVLVDFREKQAQASRESSDQLV